jgi:hypothetical protein
MRISPTLAVAAIMLFSSAVTNAQTLPAYMAPISGKTAAIPSEIATKDMLALNTGMFELYGDAAKVFQKNILSKHPVILALFSGAGGRMILCRPGMAPMDAPQVPIVYQLLTQHDGAGAGRRSLCRQPRRQVLARCDARLPQPNAVGARRS